jgi:hypothetical protein
MSVPRGCRSVLYAVAHLVGHCLETKHKEPKVNTNVQKLQKAGILPTPHALTTTDEKVIDSLSPDEVKAWVNIKEKLDKAGVKDQPAKFFI